MFYPSCNQVSKVSDTTTAQASRGKDIQGIPWDRLQFTREKYRETRLQQYKNYENLLQSHDDLEKECKSVEKGGNFYHFRYNTRSVKSTIVHFQVKLLLNWGNYLICCFKIWFIRQWLVLSALLGSVSFFYGSQGCSIFNDPCDTDSVDVLLLVCNTAEKLSVGNIKA
jgi:hypothetical protein